VTTFSLELCFIGCVMNLFELSMKAITTVVTEQDSKTVREVNQSNAVFSTTNSYMKWEDVVLQL
jgi:hypothetical protein